MNACLLPVLATFSIHTARAASRHPSVVVMQAIEDWECHDPTVSLGQSRHRLLLAQALMSPSVVVVAELDSRGAKLTPCAYGREVWSTSRRLREETSPKALSTKMRKACGDTTKDTFS